MADVSATLAAWSSTTASNSPSGATTIGTGLDDNLREIQGVIVRGLSHKGSDIASVAGTTDIGAVEGLMHDITGAEAITGLGTVRAGILKILKFEGAATLTHNATSLILPGAANIVCANGDVGIFISEGSGNWRCLHFMRANGSHLGPVLGTAAATTSGTTVAFTGIPPWAKKITVCFAGVSTNGTSALILQLGDSGGVESTGYLSASAPIDGAATQRTDSFSLATAMVAAQTVEGQFVLTLENSGSFRWTGHGTLLQSSTNLYVSAGSKALSAVLTQILITTASGDTFDAGEINIVYE